jgi:Icc-related predicted phosphoesterase
VHGIFVSDLHGSIPRYRRLFQIIREEKPDSVFFGGDLLPLHLGKQNNMEEFIDTILFSEMKKIHQDYDKNIRFFVILGNDDPRIFEPMFLKAEVNNLLDYVHQKVVPSNQLYIAGYSYVPPTPFQLKDWERYDVSQFVDVGVIPPEQGIRTVDVPLDEIRYSTIAEDLELLAKQSPAKQTIYLFHSPPYQTCLDQANLEGKQVDYAPMDVHVGSIAIQRFIQQHQPLLTLHGHVHEAAQLTGCWKIKTGKTYSFSAAHHGPELAVIRFDTTQLQKATRELLSMS